MSATVARASLRLRGSQCAWCMPAVPTSTALNCSNSQWPVRCYATQVSVSSAEDGQLKHSKRTQHGKPFKRPTHSIDPAIAKDRLYLDPVKVANRTNKFLQSGAREEALDFLRPASKLHNYTVSWNHVLNEFIKAGKVQTAFSLFTEMRDRGQKPDSHTYTILLRGLAQHIEKTPTAVERAVTLIGLLQSPQSRVRLHTIHVNAAIEVCAKARNIDALYSIAAKLPETGPGAPNAITFTIVLECLRQTTVQQLGSSELSEADKLHLRREAVLQGKRLWADVIERWRKNILTMDELLMDAMGRILLLGEAQEFDEILSLVQQTTMLNREIPSIGAPTRNNHIAGAPIPTEKLPPPPPSKTSESEELALPAQGDKDVAELAPNPQNLGLFNPVRKRIHTHVFVQPGGRTLSLLMKACGMMKAFGAAQRYWDKVTALTSPDLDNYNQYMRIIVARHNSLQAAELLRQICTPTNQDGLGLEPKPITFRLAMAACAGDGNNAQCLEHARTILRLQATHVSVPDARTLKILLDLLSKRNGQWPISEMSATLELIEESRRSLQSFTSFGHGTQTSKSAASDEQRPSADLCEQVADLTQRFYRLVENAVSIYREQLDLDTFRAWNKLLYRNRNKATRAKIMEREQWFLEQLGPKVKSLGNTLQDRESKAQSNVSYEAH